MHFGLKVDFALNVHFTLEVHPAINLDFPLKVHIALKLHFSLKVCDSLKVHFALKVHFTFYTVHFSLFNKCTPISCLAMVSDILSGETGS